MAISQSAQIFCYSAADKFLEKASVVLNVEYPEHGLTGNAYEKLTKDIWLMFINNKQTVVNFCNKMHLWNNLNNYIKAEFPGYALFIAGSTLNGFGLKDSDVDISLLDRNSYSSGRNESIIRLQQLIRSLKKDKSIDFIDLVSAIVPLIRFHETNYNLTIDINYNNVINIQNTYLLYCYSQVDWRVQPLTIIVKLWAKRQDINSARDGTMSSYSLILMVINFLQFGVKPAVLPCLQSIFKDEFKVDCDLQNFNFFKKLDIPLHVLLPRNYQTLGELLIEFFKYYDTFEFDRYAISVRLGSKIPRMQYQMQHLYSTNVNTRWKYICIEEPFNLNNVSKSVYDHGTFNKIRRVIKKTYQALCSTHDISKIFQPFESFPKNLFD